jgi:CubicO group peptidase (beta-lactamase class C family)
MLKRFTWCLLICVVLFNPTISSESVSSAGLTGEPVQVKQPDDRFARVRRQIQEAVTKGEAPSIAVAVAVEGKIVWEEGFGWADKQKQVPATPNTRYPVASVAKPFVSTGLMILAERGLVDLSRPANHYLGSHSQLSGYAGDASGATLRHILQHRAGLPPHGQYIYQDENYNPPSIDETIRRYGILVNPPGERYTYSNLGYGILAHITARVSGKSYADFMRTEVFLPLGLTRTSIEIEPQLSGEAVTLYASDGSVIPYYVFDEWGSGRVWSTAHDVVRFGMFHLKEHLSDQMPILKDTTIDQMVNDNHTTGSAGGFYGTDWFYGLGWGGRNKSEYGYRWYGHEGGMPGVSAQLKLFPEKRIAIAVLSNGRQSLTYSLIDAIADTLLPDYSVMRKEDPTSGKRPAPKPFTPTEKLLGEWKGEIRTWGGSIPVTMTFQADTDVHIKVGDELKTLVNNVRFENGRFSGDCHGTLSTPDAKRYPHQLGLNLTLRGNILNGSASAVTVGDRFHYYLPSWITLTKRPRENGR